MKRISSARYWLALLTALWLLIGCGGGGASSAPALPIYSVAVAWPARTRDLNAPASADTVTITLKGAAFSGADLSVSGRRGASSSAQSTVLTFPAAAKPGAWLMTVSFATSAGVVTATASAAVLVNAAGQILNVNGTPLGGIADQTLIQSVVIDPEQGDFMVGVPTDLNLSIQGAGGTLIAVPPGAIQYKLVVPGPFKIAGGQLVASGPGQATVTASVDGVTSSPYVIVVHTAPLALKYTNIAGLGAVYSPADGKLYVVGATYGGSTSALVRVNPSTNTIEAGLTISQPTGLLALSPDGSTLYVGEVSNTSIAQIDLSSFTKTREFSLTQPANGASVTANSLAVSPTDPTYFVVSSYSAYLIAYKNGVQLPDQVSTNGVVASSLTFDTGAAVFGTNGELLRATVGPSGITNLANSTRVLNLTAILGVNAGKVYTNTGGIYDATSLALVGNLNISGLGPLAAFDSPDNIAYLIANSTLLKYNLGSMSVVDSTSIASALIGDLLFVNGATLACIASPTQYAPSQLAEIDLPSNF